jgi:hypothetical protein
MAPPEVTGRKVRPGAQTKGKAQLARGPPVPAACYSIAEFCDAHRISIDHYFKQQREGLGPTVMKVGARTLISFESAAEWRRACEEASKRVVVAAE